MKRPRRLTSLLLSLLLLLGIAVFAGAANAAGTELSLQQSVQTIFADRG